MINSGMMSSNSGEWETPQDFFDGLNSIYQFTLDAAATWRNAKCKPFYTKMDNALKKDWPGSVWCNPPYGREIVKFVGKGWREAQKGSTQAVVMLLPARTDTRWWHDWVMRASVIYLVRGRLKFVGAKSSAPFPSAVAVFRSGSHHPRFLAISATGRLLAPSYAANLLEVQIG